MSAVEITSLLVAIVGVGGFLLSMRSTSFNELKELYKGVREDFDKYKQESEKKEAEYEQKVDDLVRLNERFRRYIDRLIKQLEKNGITPEKMEE